MPRGNNDVEAAELLARNSSVKDFQSPGHVHWRSNSNSDSEDNMKERRADSAYVSAYATPRKQANADPPRLLCVFSAKSEASLRAYLKLFPKFITTLLRSEGSLHDLAYTLGQRRSHFAYRLAATTDNLATLSDKIASLDTSQVGRTGDPVIAFVFTGQGAQHAYMVAKLRCWKIFNDTLLRAERRLFELGATWSLIEEFERPEPESHVSLFLNTYTPPSSGRNSY